MKNLFKLMTLSLTVGLLLLPTTAVFAEGVPSGTTIDNEAYVGGDNFENKTNSIATNVQRIIGASWAAGPDISPAGGGISYSNISTLLNLGNTNYNFRITVDTAITDTVSGPVDGWWAYEVFTNDVSYLAVPAGDVSVQGGNIYLLDGSSVEVKIKVLVSAGAFGGWQEWRLSADTLETHANTNRYVGDNGVGTFGGPVNLGWGESGEDLVTIYDAGGPDRAFRIIVAAPNMTITKSISGVVTGSAAAPDGVVIPGATITYVVRISNGIAAMAANNVVVYDTFDNVNTTYVAAPGATGANVTDNGGDNVWNASRAGAVVKMTNTGSTAFEPGDVATLTFEVTIN